MHFPFEDFTLVMTRDCNFSCRYCPLDHFSSYMDNNVIRKFIESIIEYNNYDIYITLFGGEPLLNKKGMFYLLNYLINNYEKIKKNNINIVLKIVTNGVLIDEDYINIFKTLSRIENIKLIIQLSLDGSKKTQLDQRNFRNKKKDYYDELDMNISKLLNIDGLNLELGMVMDIFNKNILKDILYLINKYKTSLLIMPVDLKYSYIMNNDADVVSYYVGEYLSQLKRTIKYLKKMHNIKKYIKNFQKDFMDIKMPPMGPAIDTNGDVYTTRDFLFTMDKNNFSKIGNIKNEGIKKKIYYFSQRKIEEMEEKALKLYYGRTFYLNKTVIGDYFTKLMYQ